jgi:hypothetical protein
LPFLLCGYCVFIILLYSYSQVSPVLPQLRNTGEGWQAAWQSSFFLKGNEVMS